MDKVNKQELRRLAEEAKNGELVGPYMLAMPDDVLSLLDELEENDGVIAVWRGRLQRAEAELEQYRRDAESLRGSCKALGEQNKLLTRRVKSLARAANWLADTGWGVARPKWLTAILAKEGGANG